MSDLRDLQLQHEELSDTQAAAERFATYKRGANEGDINMPRAQRFIARAFGTVKDSIDAALAVQTRGMGGKFKGWLRKVPSDVLAVIALREVVGICTSKGAAPTIQMIAGRIGKLYEMEAKIREAEKVNPLYMKRIHDQVHENSTTNQRHLRNLYNVAYNAVMKGEIDSSLTQSELLQLGKFGAQAVMDAGIMVRKEHGTSLGGTQFELNPDVLEFILDYTMDDVHDVVDSQTGAMMCVPDEWTNLRDGGYLTARRKFLQPLMDMGSVRRSERARLRKEVYTAEHMPLVFEAGNYLQSQRFALHMPTVDAITRLWEAGGGVMGVPTRSGPVRPAFPFPETWVKADASEHELEVFTNWKRSCLAYYAKMKEWRGRSREVGGFIKVARAASDSLYFPVFLDRRGRWYYRGIPNPQGSDLSKASLHFGDKKPLGADGLYWLKVHIANSFGFDKVRFDERAKWTDANWTSIQVALSSPEDHPDVWGDAPWCTFSAAWELNQALLSGHPEAYESGVIVHMDATCSGLQHFSAILRDPVGGSYVNLIDDGMGGAKQDIYTRVSQNAMQAMQLDVDGEDAEIAAMARWWLARGIPRNMAKKPVMTYVYGATLQGTTDFVEAFVNESADNQWPEGLRQYDVAQYAARKLFRGISMTVPSAEAAMRWLRNVVDQMPRGRRMEWTTPTGFRVQHDYQSYEEVRVELRSCGVRTAVMREYIDGTRPTPMRNAVAPNFVHALDASHLTLTAVAMKQNNLAIVGIHDSYGTHACDVSSMHRCIRTSFVALYEGRNVLAEFLWEVGGIGEVPMRGELNIRSVLDSEFFFS